MQRKEPLNVHLHAPLTPLELLEHVDHNILYFILPGYKHLLRKQNLTITEICSSQFDVYTLQD